MHLRELAPVPRPRVRQEHLAPHRDPVRLQVVRQVARLSVNGCGSTRPWSVMPQKCSALLVHSLEHGPERPHRPEPRVVREHDLVELRDRGADVVEAVLVAPDVEAAFVADEDLVGDRLELRAPGIRQRAVDDDDDAVGMLAQMPRARTGCSPRRRRAILHDVDEQPAAVCGEPRRSRRVATRSLGRSFTVLPSVRGRRDACARRPRSARTHEDAEGDARTAAGAPARPSGGSGACTCATSATIPPCPVKPARCRNGSARRGIPGVVAKLVDLVLQRAWLIAACSGVQDRAAVDSRARRHRRRR